MTMVDEDYDAEDNQYVVSVPYEKCSLKPKTILNLGIECCCVAYKQQKKQMKVYFEDIDNAEAFTSFINNHPKV